MTGEALKSALQACEQIQDNFFKRRDLRVPSKLMMDIVRRHVGVSEKLLPGLIENLHSARTPYLQIQAAEMLTVYLKAEKVSVNMKLHEYFCNVVLYLWTLAHQHSAQFPDEISQI